MLDAARDDVPLLAAVSLLSAMHVSANAGSPPTRPTIIYRSVVAFEEAVQPDCGLPSLKAVTLLIDAVLLESPAGIDGQTRVVGAMRILARALRQIYLLRGGEEGCLGGPALLGSSNWRLLLLASALIASKFAEDEYAGAARTLGTELLLTRSRPHRHVELDELHNAALDQPVGVPYHEHPPSCDQIASAEIALIRLLDWHVGFNGGELLRQRTHLAKLAEQARHVVYYWCILACIPLYIPQRPAANYPYAYSIGVCHSQVVGEAEILTPADCAFLQSRAWKRRRARLQLKESERWGRAALRLS